MYNDTLRFCRGLFDLFSFFFTIKRELGVGLSGAPRNSPANFKVYFLTCVDFFLVVNGHLGVYGHGLDFFGGEWASQRLCAPRTVHWRPRAQGGHSQPVLKKLVSLNFLFIHTPADEC